MIKWLLVFTHSDDGRVVDCAVWWQKGCRLRNQIMKVFRSEAEVIKPSITVGQRKGSISTDSFSPTSSTGNKYQDPPGVLTLFQWAALQWPTKVLHPHVTFYCFRRRSITLPISSQLLHVFYILTSLKHICGKRKCFLCVSGRFFKHKQRGGGAILLHACYTL